MSESPEHAPVRESSDADRARRLVDMYVSPPGSIADSAAQGFAPPVPMAPPRPPVPQPNPFGAIDPLATSPLATSPLATSPLATSPLATSTDGLPVSVLAAPLADRTLPVVPIVGTLNGGPPTLPSVTLAPPAAPPAAAGSYTTTASTPPEMTTFVPSGAAKRHKSKSNSGGAGKFLARLLMLLIVAGVAAAGVMYGPQLFDRMRGDDPNESVGDDAAEVDALEPVVSESAEAPLEIPAAPATPPVVRTATFTVDREIDGIVTSARYTIDFDTGATRALIERPEGTDVEVLSLFDEAVVREAGGDAWYSVGRGAFPFANGVDIDEWVPTVDRLIAPEQRDGATVERASFETIGGVDTTHLVVSNGPSTWEFWVDEQGLVRRQFIKTTDGSKEITVVDVSEEAWVPEFPAREVRQPLTAEALLRFGL